MGLLSLGTPLHWKEAKQYANHVRQNGIEQFLSIYHRVKERQHDRLRWGDEVEYMVISYDDEQHNARLSLRVFEILAELEKEEKEAQGDPEKMAKVKTAWRPEYGRFMLEGTPGVPYNGDLNSLLNVELNMKLRRSLVREYLKPNETIISMTSFPRLGAPGVFLDPHSEPEGQSSHSLFVPDEAINPHARFPTLTANIRRRRGSKVAINMPIFHDVNTPRPFHDPTIPVHRNLFAEDEEAAQGAALPDHIYMDAMVFGMGCSCLQITFQACNIVEARRLYDQLAPVGPIMLALTAAAPIFRGYLADVDCRWSVIAQSVDDRTDEERGIKPLEHDRFVINKSRYDSIDCYIATDKQLRPEYNDINLVYDKDICQQLMDNDVDERLARHVAHLFIRDPLVIYRELVEQDNSKSSDHFENIQSTNWQTMRFKPPPPNADIGWRVEFRSMEIQLTDFENAAFAIFVVLLTRAMLSFNLNFYIPMSKVDENMKRAHHRGAVLNEKFYFRKQVMGTDDIPWGPVEDEYELMSIDEIINGQKEGSFPGLIPIIHSYLNSINMDVETGCYLSRYLAFIRARANGTLMTTAAWIRKFVQNHPDYKHDSVVSQQINYDLVRAMDAIGNGSDKAPELLGQFA
ncbi:glutamate-cysteine ligase-domain-containing protein [Syncephalis plumigaleata]|nr:glutamate-cysteine ligase-domain-containing protein [Syncephalis plumigaleata]